MAKTHHTVSMKLKSIFEVNPPPHPPHYLLPLLPIPINPSIQIEYVQNSNQRNADLTTKKTFRTGDNDPALLMPRTETSIELCYQWRACIVTTPSLSQHLYASLLIHQILLLISLIPQSNTDGNKITTIEVETENKLKKVVM
jgi:hypothetical protein